MQPEWYYEEDGQQQGPITFEQLRERAAAGLLRPNDLVWGPGLRDWKPASTQSGLFGSGNAPTAIPPREYEDRWSADDRPRPAPNAGPLMKVILFGCGGFMVLTMLCCGAFYLIALIAPQVDQKIEQRGFRNVGDHDWELKNGASTSWAYHFNQGEKVTLVVISGADSDMDLFVFTNKRDMESFALAPNPEESLKLCLVYDNDPGKDCRVKFTATEKRTYWILLINRESEQENRNIANNGKFMVKVNSK